MTVQNADGPRAIMRFLFILSAMSGGDVSPLIALLKYLRARGHETLSIIDDSSLQRGDQLGPVLHIPPDRTLHSYLVRSSADASRQFASALQWSQDVAPSLLRSIRSFQPHATICSDTTLAMGIRFRQTAQIPLCLLNTTFCYSESASRPLERDFGPEALPWIRSVRTAFKYVDLLLHATDPVFDEAAHACSGQNEYWIGPLFWERQCSTPDYLSQTEDWILVTASTAPQMDEQRLARTAIRALGDYPYVIATLGNIREQLPLALAENVHIEAYVPHSKVLSRTKLVIAHGGHGTVMKSLYWGVPLILVPWGRDQIGVAERAHALGVAKVIQREHLTVNSLRKAIGEFNASDEMCVQAMRHSERMRKIDALARAERDLIDALRPEAVALPDRH